MVVDNKIQAEKFLKLHLSKILEEFQFENQCKKNPNFCPCYKNKKTCHEHLLEKQQHNCFLCYCPWYDNSKPEGGCKKSNPLGKGKFFQKPDGTKIWDCTDCTYPHQKKVVKKFLKEIFEKNV